MKKIRNILLSLVLVMVMLTASGCFGSDDSGNNNGQTQIPPSVVETITDPFIVDTNVDKSTALYLVQSAYFKLRTADNVRDGVRVTREYKGKTEENYVFYDSDETRWGWVAYTHNWTYNSIYSETEYQRIETAIYSYTETKKTTYSDNSVETKDTIGESVYGSELNSSLIYILMNEFYDIDKITVADVNSAVLLSNGNIILSRKDRPYSFNETNKTQTIFYMDYEINSKGEFVSVKITSSVEQFESKTEAQNNETGTSLGGYSNVYKFEYNLEIPQHIKTMYANSKAKYEAQSAS